MAMDGHAESSALVELRKREETIRSRAQYHRKMAEEFAESKRVELELAEESERLADEYAAIIAATQ